MYFHLIERFSQTKISWLATLLIELVHLIFRKLPQHSHVYRRLVHHLYLLPVSLPHLLYQWRSNTVIGTFSNENLDVVQSQSNSKSIVLAEDCLQLSKAQPRKVDLNQRKGKKRSRTRRNSTAKGKNDSWRKTCVSGWCSQTMTWMI